MSFERLKDGELGAGIASMHKLFEQVIEVCDQAITEAEFVLAGQALQQGNKPADQIETGLDDRQLTAGAGKFRMVLPERKQIVLKTENPNPKQPRVKK